MGFSQTKNAVITRNLRRSRDLARDGSADDPARRLRTLALGNFFRIIVFDVTRFFDSVSRTVRVFESLGLNF
jgi:hypothetical protein